jgi:ATP-dependent Clp protease protease subunit
MSKHAKRSSFFRASVRSDGALELLVYEEIGYDWWTGEGVTAKSVKQQIDQAGQFSKIVLRVNSPGGDAFEGIAIYNLLRSVGKPIDVFVDGVAASSASIIAMAGDTITVGNNAMIMIHDAWSMCVGNAREMRKFADTLEKVSDSIGQTYVDRTGKTMEEIKSLMDSETWMNAEECVKEGFATAIAEFSGEQKALAIAKQFKAFSKMRRLPEVFRPEDTAVEPECECQCSACMNGDCEECTEVGCEDPNCTDCPMQSSASAEAETTSAESDLSLYEARITLLGRKTA